MLRLAQFEDLFDARADLSWFLRPLCGKTLICDCDHPHACPGSSLVKYVHKCFALASAGPISGSSGSAVASDADDWGDEQPLLESSFRLDDRHAIDETLRGRPQVHAERPQWPKAWSLLVACIRAAQVLLFWEMFSGTAGLTKAFQSQGWECAPPVDIMFDDAYNLMDPGFCVRSSWTCPRTSVQIYSPRPTLFIILDGGESIPDACDEIFGSARWL